MVVVKKIWGRFEYIVYCCISLLRMACYAKKKCQKIFLMGIPIHGNLGDQAIVTAEREFLKDNFSNYVVIEVESGIVLHKLEFLKKVVGDSLILIHGGGFIGTIWPKEDYMARSIVKNFGNNIIILPQTVFFDDDIDGRRLLEEDKYVYEKKKNLQICLREKYSYDFMRSNFGKCRIYRMPDMVLYLKPVRNRKEKSNRVTICLRNDVERVFSDINSIEDRLRRKGYFDFNVTDTVVARRLYVYNRVKKVRNKIQEFANSKLVVTDRLHGMLFAYLAGTPCVVIQSKSYKVRGVFDWIKYDKKIAIVKDMDEFDRRINEVLMAGHDGCCRTVTYDRYGKWYERLCDLIRKNL